MLKNPSEKGICKHLNKTSSSGHQEKPGHDGVWAAAVPMLRLSLCGRQEAGPLAVALGATMGGSRSWRGDTQPVPALDPLDRGVVTSWCYKDLN